ncbi:MAG TPA: metallophosphoesterase family protein, partial [Alphaproteobacteria bacterium]|nr:metallophosphoesterase family protein [Alphaproteobacteria bacterium]
DAEAVTALIRAAGMPVVMGNCEESLGSGGEDCGCGFAEGSDCDIAARHWFTHAAAELSEASRAWMGGLPRIIRFRFAGRRFAAIHGGAEQINRFIFASTPAGEKRAALAALQVDAVIAGHCGIPFTQVLDGRLWHNPGVIGMPANDGTPRVWYSLLEADADGGIRIRHRALAYDHAGAAAAMRAQALPEGYAAALVSGLWPSLDILPAAERAATGRPLDLSDTQWAAVPARHAS